MSEASHNSPDMYASFTGEPECGLLKVRVMSAGHADFEPL